jgi:D-tyrosyl-tRNA(Tyr) deacylase
VAGGVTGKIGAGFLVLAGFSASDTDANLDWMAEKILGLRLFDDAQGKMNLDLDEAGGALLIVSQFTLYGDARKGRRPSFTEAASLGAALPLYERFITLLKERSGGMRIETGAFGAMMEVELVNDGPVTLVLDK